MEHEKIEGMAKKIWKIVKVALLMLRKGICKRKILLDLNIMMKRGKLAGKSIRNLILLHHHHHHQPRHHRRQVSAADVHCAATPAADEDSDSDEVSCTTSPVHDCHAEEVVNGSSRVLETMMVTSSRASSDVAASPRLRFGRGPVTRELRITDSPFPLHNDPDETRRVNQAADDFIKRFYSQIKRQQD